MCDMGERRRKIGVEYKSFVVVGYKKRREKNKREREKDKKGKLFFLSAPGCCAKCANIELFSFLLQDVDDTIDRILNIHTDRQTDRQLFNLFFS